MSKITEFARITWAAARHAVAVYFRPLVWGWRVVAASFHSAPWARQLMAQKFRAVLVVERLEGSAPTLALSAAEYRIVVTPELESLAEIHAKPAEAKAGEHVALALSQIARAQTLDIALLREQLKVAGVQWEVELTAEGVLQIAVRKATPENAPADPPREATERTLGGV